jgi:predicted nucleotidyltransferase
MTWRTAEVERAIEAMLAYVRETFSPRGIVVAGSIVRGEAGPRSDLDVLVIHDEPWRSREQHRFAGIATELFVNPPAQFRRYFASEHERGRPSTADMFATGEPIAPVDPVVDELIREAREWMVKPIQPSRATLESMRYAAVDLIDDARDVIEAGGEPATARLMLADAVARIVGYAFQRRGRFLPRRKRAVEELAQIDPDAAALVREWASRRELVTVETLARRVLGVDTFFEWSSERERVTLE